MSKPTPNDRERDELPPPKPDGRVDQSPPVPSTAELAVAFFTVVGSVVLGILLAGLVFSMLGLQPFREYYLDIHVQWSFASIAVGGVVGFLIGLSIYNRAFR